MLHCQVMKKISTNLKENAVKALDLLFEKCTVHFHKSNQSFKQAILF